MMRRTIFSLTAISLLLLVSSVPVWGSGPVVPGKTLTERWTGSKWVKVSSPSPSGGDLLNGVDALTASNAWAVGQHGNVSTAHPLIEHWNGSKWSTVTGDTTPNGSWLDAVSMISATDGWAVGHDATGQRGRPLVEHWDGSKWLAAGTPGAPGGELFGVDAAATDDVWAVGSDGSSKTLIEHWDGTNWSVVSSPAPGETSGLRGVAAISANDAWAVGFTAPVNHAGHALSLHWNGTTWSVVKSFSSVSDLTAVTARGSKDVFAAGSRTDSSGCLRTLVLHWKGSSWKQMTTPNPFSCDNELAGIGSSSKAVEAVGSRPQNCPGSSCRLVTLAMRLVNGSWKLQSSPNSTLAYNRLLAAGMVPGKNLGWAVGYATNTATG